MYRIALGVLLQLISALALGCGSDRIVTGSATDQESATALLIQARDLPAGTTRVGIVPSEPCEPSPVLERTGSPAVKSSMFALGQVRVQEAVAIFSTAAAANDAYNALTTKARLECIRDAIAIQGDFSVTILPPRDIGEGGDGQAILFKARDQDSEQQNSVEIVSIKSGLSVASMIFLDPTAKPIRALVDHTVSAADRLLSVRSSGS